MNEEIKTEDWLKATDGIAETLAKIGEPLSDSQRIVLSGAIATWFKHVHDAAVEKGREQLWQPIETAPKDGRTLLLGARNRLDNWRTMRGQWYSQERINDEWDDPDGAEAGWYETSVEADPPNCWTISPSHWMPLPPAPLSASKETVEGDQDR